MLMDLAYSLDKYLDKGKQHNNTLQIITFDGEEAFKYWSSTWSIVTIGTFNILHLKSEKTSTSPFNVFEPFQNPISRLIKCETYIESLRQTTVYH
jgi:hypothetical protein